ncbi:hypothetical protein [Rhodococcus opacus]|uniref:hypothetical protein n=1 Tax=Rhodococcus opacus TaxID=37919 RepID=UPI00155A6380|nr:hypothetical protein [Rhodococcus opacus]
MVDEIADITLAADEVCTQLIASARPGSDLHCTVTTAEHGLRITIAALVEHPGVPRRQGIGWHVLDTLTDSLSVSENPADTDPIGWDVVVDFVKHHAIELGLADDRGQPALTCPAHPVGTPRYVHRVRGRVSHTDTPHTTRTQPTCRHALRTGAGTTRTR